MITGWRTLWKEGDFPFLYVQLANLAQRYRDNWPLVREAQFKTLSLPKTGMAVTIDIGTPYYIHPPDKADVGLRLSLLARHIAYGENVVCSGPLYAAMKVEGANIRISFRPDTIGGGLVIGSSPWKDPKAKTVPSTTELQGFMIAGAGQEVGQRAGDHRWEHRGGFERSRCRTRRPSATRGRRVRWPISITRTAFPPRLSAPTTGIPRVRSIRQSSQSPEVVPGLASFVAQRPYRLTAKNRQRRCPQKR